MDLRKIRVSAALLCGLFLCLSYSVKTAHAKTCVLNFERNGAPIAQVVDNVFVGAPDLELHDGAGPLDLLECIKDRSDEIVIIGHALENPATLRNNAANLGYFTQTCGADLQDLLATRVQSLSDEIDGIAAHLKANPQSPDQHQMRQDAAKLQELLGQYKSWPLTRPLYSVKPLLPKIMERAREELDRQAQSPDGVSLKRIRLMSCLPKQVLNQYDDLRALLKDHSISLDIAPAQPLMSLIYGKTVTSPDLQWLSKSVNCFALKSWRTDRNSWCEKDYWPDCDRRKARYCLPAKR